MVRPESSDGWPMGADSDNGGSAPDADEAARARERGRILVVEDDPATLRFVTLALERAGFAVASATSGPVALELLGADDAVDVLLADIGLPGMSGFDVIREARRRVPGLATALMTADASVDVAVNALRSEVDDFLPKPIAPQALVAQIERLIERRRTRFQHLPERVLAIGAHPDDVEIGVGGILVGHGKVGDEITVLTMSHGARGGDSIRRAEEAERAAERLGAKLILQDLEDTRVPMADPTVNMIESVIEEFRPTVVYTHTSCDLHQDHRNVHQATLVATRSVANVYCYESPSATVKFAPARFVDIDANLDDKVAMLAVFTSQSELRAYLAEDLVRATARYWGRYGQSLFSEPLEVVRDRPQIRQSAADMSQARP
jgi:LmbE family N-acetylglucosaminyl deacetylase/CheY-like chemotaxis protein